MKWRRLPNAETGSPGDDPDDANTIILKLHKQCFFNGQAEPDETDPKKLYIDSDVYAKDLIWEPVGRQNEWFPEPDGVIRPANPDILLAKLRPGQEIDLEMHCILGDGADHAKFSPVATASYRLHPTINILAPILGADAKKFAGCFPEGVIGLEKVTAEDAKRDERYDGHVGGKKALVKNAFKDTVSRECLRHDEFKNKVKLGRIRDHFIFGVESTGQFPSDDLFIKSVKALRDKCITLKKHLDKLERHGVA